MSIPDSVFNEAWNNLDNRNILRNIAKRYKFLGSEELKFRSQMALWNCLKSHKSERGNKFTTSLHRHMFWQCQKAIKEYNKAKKYNYVSVQNLTYEDKLEDTLGVADILQQLPNELSKVLIEYHMYGKSLRKIGRENGYSSTIARKYLKQGEESFRDLFGVL